MTITLTIILSVLLGACTIPFWYFSIAFNLSIVMTLSLILALFITSSSYILGDRLGQRTSVFVLKRMGGIAMGTTSIGVVIGLLGFFSGTFIQNVSLTGRILALSWAGSVVLATIFERQTPRITTVNLTLNLNTPSHTPSHTPPHTPLHIVQLTDIHLNGLKSAKQLERWVHTVNQLKPDVIVFTGDLLDIPPQLLKKELNILSKLHATHAKLAVSGNHDFYTSDFHYPQTLQDIGFQYLDNQRVEINGVSFIGLPDKAGVRHHIHRKDIADLLPKNAPQPIILLDHRPDEFKQSVNAGVTLQLSGHTHWGQIPPWGLLVRLRYKYGMGLGKYKNGVIYTSKGTSVWGPPMRLFGRSEIVSLWVS